MYEMYVTTSHAQCSCAPLRINAVLTRQAAKLLVCYSQVYVYFTQVGDIHSQIYLSHSFAIGPLHCRYSCLHSEYLE